jgi:23S rRNA (adenine-N6)-dimethyltransferase
MDIGAGSGRLTAELARVARLVIAVEIDPYFARQLRGRWANVEVVEDDATTMELPAGPFRVVANLPFSHTNELLHLLLDDPGTALARADLVVEWGVACKRGLPWPSTVSGVLWGATFEASVARRLPRAAFEPAPAVDAGVLVFRRRPCPLVPPGLAPDYRAFVAGGFRRGLRTVADARGLERLGHTRAWARDLDAHQWAELFLAAGGRSSGGGRPRSCARRRPACPP